MGRRLAMLTIGLTPPRAPGRRTPPRTMPRTGKPRARMATLPRIGPRLPPRNWTFWTGTPRTPPP